MSKPLIVIADMDTAYLAELENKFLVELGDRAELEIISDPEYFEQFFSNPVTAEIVAVNENLYTNALQRQDIQNLFILSEHQDIFICFSLLNCTKHEIINTSSEPIQATGSAKNITELPQTEVNIVAIKTLTQNSIIPESSGAIESPSPCNIHLNTCKR